MFLIRYALDAFFEMFLFALNNVTQGSGCSLLKFEIFLLSYRINMMYFWMKFWRGIPPTFRPTPPINLYSLLKLTS